MARTEFDYIVVGGGSGGCVVAGRLSEDPAVRVCLIEAGPDDRHISLRVPALTFMAVKGERFLTRDQSEPEPTLGGRSVPWVHGRVLGGGSSVNGMIYGRGHSSTYDGWQCEGWSFEDVLHYFRRSERSERGADRWHGGEGPLRVAKGASLLPIAEAWLEGLAACGYPIVDDLNADPAEGFGHFDQTIGDGVRSSSATAFLDRRRPNLTILTDTRALRVLFEGRRARGVEVMRNGRPETLYAAGEVILAGGAVYSPHLLMVSGVGKADHLREHGVEVVADSPQVGQNLQNHLRYPMSFTCEAPATAFQHRKPLNSAIGGLQYLFGRKGFLSRTTMCAGGGLKSDPSMEVADIKVSLFNGLIGSANGRKVGMLPAEEGCQLSVHQGSPHSRGEIRLGSGDPAARPRIYPRNFTDPRDMPALMSAVRQMRKVMASAPLARLGVREAPPLDDLTDAELDADIRSKVMNIYHDVGSCRMGMDAGSVVDEKLRVRGVEGLRIADGSIIPQLMNANTNAPIIMVGEKAADMIRAAR